MRKIKEQWRARLRIIMQKAWGLFRHGIVSFSLSLRLSWSIAKGQTNEFDLLRKLTKRK
ncbi:hypothetical protein [Arundinibacter roseus]|uniref:hypothetical protein n=1 Tax=Arundinibacter roseus TaxID=2070510 RepID=UPI00140478B3|nr:hypothetical protein [Arundinibacter roseus]